MKKFFLIPVFWFFLSFTVFAESISLVGNSWPPYVNKTHAKKGLVMEIVTTALQQKGYQSRMSIEDWPRALEGIEIGIFDVVVAIWKTPEREKKLLYSKPYLVNQIKFIKMKSTEVKYQTLDDLKGYLIGVVKGYAYDEKFNHSQALIKIPKNHIIQNLLKLTQGEIDLTLGDERAIRYEINQYMSGYADRLEFLSKPLSKRGLYIAVSKQHPNAKKIISDFDQSIETMLENGTIAALIKKYE